MLHGHHNEGGAQNMGALAMSYAGVSDTSTWAAGLLPRRHQESGAAVRKPVRGFLVLFNAGGWRQPYLPPLQTTRPRAVIEVPQEPGAALGAMTPNAVRVKAQREQNYVAAFNAGAEVAAEMAAADEMDPPEPDIWEFALGALGHLAALVSPPLVNPLQLGGVSCEWHELGMNIELRFRGLADIYAIIEDARGDLLEFRGRDPELRHAMDALRVLVERQV
jgi:hypothetical protein